VSLLAEFLSYYCAMNATVNLSKSVIDSVQGAIART
jgi:hypothetical protein